MIARAVAGARVLVPVQKRTMVGIVTALNRPAPKAKARAILEAPDSAPLLDATLLQLAEWVAVHYAASPGLVLRAMLPAVLFSEGRPVRRTAEDGSVELITQPLGTRRLEKTERVFKLAQDSGLLDRARFARAPRQLEAVEALTALGGEGSVSQLTAAGVRGNALKSLLDAGIVTERRETRERDPFAAIAGTAPPDAPTHDQLSALRALQMLSDGEVALLFGVTGSGKTLVYLEYLKRMVAGGRSVIVLVPEIGLTPQTVARFRGMFGDTVAVLHSGLSDGERYDAWRALREGRKKVAVGARSAIFAAVPHLGAIVVDEEHDGSYKQAEPAPRYHARQVAMRRAALSGARVVLGSATPALETWAAAKRGAVRLIELPERVGSRPLPPVSVVDMRGNAGPPGPVPWSDALDQAVAGALSRGEQAMLLLNRRGFSTFVQCPNCGFVVECPNCSLALTFHRSPPVLRCHHCDHRQPPPVECPECGEQTQKFRGAGTQQVEEFVAARFPSARIARMDVDTTRGKWAHAQILDEVGAGRIDILVGTQMIAKGLDFPNVTVVGVVDADVALNLPDFRAGERTFQLLTQVAGRAGRGPKGGRVLVQTRQPANAAILTAARHDVAGFSDAELQERRDPPYPPHVHLANVLVSGVKETAVAEAALALQRWLVRLFDARPDSRTEILGPAPCPIEKVRGRFRWHLLLRTEDPARLTRLVGYVAAKAPVPSTVRLMIDRDPVALL